MQQQSTASDLAMTAASYGLTPQQQQGMAYGLMQQGIPADLNSGPYGRTSMYSDQAAHGSYGLGQHAYGILSTQSDSAPASLPPLRYPIDHMAGHFHAQQAYAAWIHDDSHSQFQPVVRLSSSVPPGGPINSSFPDAVQSTEGAMEGFQDGQWPLRREPIREYVGQPLSYRGLGAPSRSEVWSPGFSDTVRNRVPPFKGIPGVLTPKKRITMKTLKQNGPTGGVGGPGWCSICQIDCTTKEILQQHKGGKKHKNRLQRQELQISSGDQKIVNENVVKSCPPMFYPNGLAETNRNQNLVAMESQTGRQQQQQLMGKQPLPDEKQNLGGKAQSTAWESNLEKRKQKVKGTADDIACKRQKLLDVGTSIEAVKVCSLCNVVCNSQIVFDSHLSGRKHAARLKNLDEVGNPVLVANNDAKKPAAAVEVGDEDVNAD